MFATATEISDIPLIKPIQLVSNCITSTTQPPETPIVSSMWSAYRIQRRATRRDCYATTLLLGQVGYQIVPHTGQGNTQPSLP